MKAVKKLKKKAPSKGKASDFAMKKPMGDSAKPPARKLKMKK